MCRQQKFLSQRKIISPKYVIKMILPMLSIQKNILMSKSSEYRFLV